jgi:hypothetical protein
MLQKAKIQMTIRYSDGHVSQAVLLSRTEHSLRVALPGADDAAEFRETNGNWSSEDGAVVEVDFSFGGVTTVAGVSLDDCICSPQLASTLVMMLHSKESEPAGNDRITGSTRWRRGARCRAVAGV